MTTASPYDDQEVARKFTQGLQELPTAWVMCRDVRHGWVIRTDYHVVPHMEGNSRVLHIVRELECIRCGTVRHESYVQNKWGGIEKLGQHYSYPVGYQIKGVPRGVKPAEMIRAESFRRAMESVPRTKSA